MGSHVKKPRRGQAHFVAESLEERKLLTAPPWNPYAIMIHQDQAVQNYPLLTGAGETVAVIDSGIDYNAPLLGGGFGPGYKVIGGYNFINNTPDPMDANGHGTGVSDLLAGNPFVDNVNDAGTTYKFQGVAPGVNLVVLAESDSAQLQEALDWVIANRTTYDIVAVNMTDFLGSNFNPTIYNSELQTLGDDGVFMATPGGNGGPGAPATYPSLSPYVVGVGAVDSTGDVASISTRGPGVDMFAPGQDVTLDYYDTTSDEPVIVSTGTGTSFASPIITGVGALMKQVNPNLTPDQILDIMQSTGTPTTDPTDGDVYSLININAAIAGAYTASGYQGNNTLATAIAIPLQNSLGSLAGLPALIGMDNYWSFNLTSPGLTSVNIGYTGSGSGPAAQLLNANGAVVGTLTAEGLTVPLAAGTYYVHVLGPSQTLAGTYSVNINAAPAVSSVPAPWVAIGVGSQSIAGSASYSNGIFIVSGSGAAIYGTADGFEFVNQTLTADGSVVAQIASQQNTNGSAKSGVMIRATSDPASPFAAMFMTPGGAYFEYRLTQGGTVSYFPVAKAASPEFLEVTRSGNSFSGFISSDGVNWTQVGSAVTLNFTGSALAGLAVSSENQSEAGTSTFDQVTVTPAVPAVQLAFVQQPSSVTVGNAIAPAVTVDIEDGGGNLITSNNSLVTLSVNSGPGTLGGTVIAQAIGGIATFSNLMLSSAGTYTLGAADSTLTTAISASFTVSAVVSTLPSPWVANGIGSQSIAGSATYSNGTFSVTGSGAAIYGSADGFEFVDQTLAADGSIVARIDSQQNTNGSAKSGVMIRATTDPGSPFAAMFMTPGGMYFEYRLTQGGAVSYFPVAKGSTPEFLEVTRTGSSFSGFISSNGTSWTQVGSAVTLNFTGSALAGLAVSSENQSEAGTSTFDQVTVTATAPATQLAFVQQPSSVTVGNAIAPAVTVDIEDGGGNLITSNNSLVTLSVNSGPGTLGGTVIAQAIGGIATFSNLMLSSAGTYTLGAADSTLTTAISASFTVSAVVSTLPSPWVANGIGSQSIAGSATYSNGTFSVTGSGAAIYGSADGFEFVDQTLAADGSIVARIDSQQNTNGSAKSGVMIRATTDPGSPFAAMFMTPGGMYFEYRLTQGGAVSYFPVAKGSTPEFLEVTRTGSSFSGFISSNGTSWTQVGSAVTLNFTGSALAGLAVSSENQSEAGTSTFDQVSVTQSNGSSTPTVTVGTNVNMSKATGNQLEDSIAVNPTNPNNIVACSDIETPNYNQIAIYRSVDGGQTWTTTIVGPALDGQSASAQRPDPRVMFDSFGNLYLVYEVGASGNQIKVIIAQSSNGGQTFKGYVAAGGTNFLADYPHIAIGPDAGNPKLQAIWISFDNSVPDRVQVVGATSSGLGQLSSYTSPVSISAEGDGNISSLAVGPGGQVAIVWENPADTAGPANILFSVNTAGLSNPSAFTPEQVLTSTNVGAEHPIPAQPDRTIDAEPILAYDNSGGPNSGRLYCIYLNAAAATGTGAADTTLYLMYSNNNGSTWSTPVQVNDGPAGHSVFNPALSVDPSTGDVGISWYDTRNSSDNTGVQYWGTVSTDGGNTFLPNFQISAGTSNSSGADSPSDPIGDLNFGDYSSLSFIEGRFVTAWADNSNSTGDNPNGTLNQFNSYSDVTIVT